MDFGRIIKNIFFLLVAIFSGLMLALITVGVTSGSELTPFNTATEEIVSHFRTPFLTSVMLLITNIGSPFVLTVLATFLAITLLLHRDTYDALLYLVSVFLSIVAFVILKNTFHLDRPAESLIADLSSWTFPSGHATVATAFFFATGYSFFDWAKTWGGRATLVIFCITSAVLVSLSRIYLGAHFALDVLAGTALGLLSVSITALAFNLLLSEREWWRRRFRSL
ncbi:phosphatase PAP2 family protein [Candidatus Parcubacteria bacterium]|nr:phosphatase PAP2 family protein [Candidatus Parcubacteria bacterium]